MAQDNESLESLGSKIANLSSFLSSQLATLDLPQPSFHTNTNPLPQDPAIQLVRLNLMESLERLQHLVTGPVDFWAKESCLRNHELLTYDVFNNFNFWDAVPIDGSASYAEIANLTNLPEQMVRRFLQLAYTFFVFAEETAGSEYVVHTAASANMAQSRHLQAVVAFNLEEARPAATVGVEALRKWFMGKKEVPEDIESCAFPLATDDGRRRGENIWDFLENFERPGQPRGYRAKRFGDAMKGLTDMNMTMTDKVLHMFDWKGLEDATVVDVGGSAGHVCALLAGEYPRLNLIVQDIPSAELAFRANIASSCYASRIHFQTHDFFKPQDLSADVFLFKSVFHNWPDKYVSLIVRNLLEVLKSGNHLIVFDIVVPSSFEASDMSTSLTMRRLFATMDLQMHILCNSKERTVEDWVNVIKRADPRFELKGIHVCQGALFGLLDFVFQD